MSHSRVGHIAEALLLSGKTLFLGVCSFEHFPTLGGSLESRGAWFAAVPVHEKDPATRAFVVLASERFTAPRPASFPYQLPTAGDEAAELSPLDGATALLRWTHDPEAGPVLLSSGHEAPPPPTLAAPAPGQPAAIPNFLRVYMQGGKFSPASLPARAAKGV